MINAQNGNAQTAHLDPCKVPPPKGNKHNRIIYKKLT